MAPVISVTTGEFLLRWLIAFGITQGVECPLYMRVFRVRFAVAFAASAITHPLVAFAIPSLWAYVIPAAESAFGHTLSDDAYFVGYGAVAETFAIVAEAVWLAWRTNLTLRRAFVASLVANVASASIGGLIYLITGYP